MILGTLAVLVVFAGCSNGSSDDFTVVESTSYVRNQEYAKTAVFPKNASGSYFGYTYWITATTKNEYKNHIDTCVYYRISDAEVGNLLKVPRGK